MICPYCGAQENDGFEFCTNCGNTLPKNNEVVQVYTAENNTYAGFNAETNELCAKQYMSGTKTSFILGIVSIALAVATNYVAAGLPAIVCGIISLIKLKGLPEVFPEYITDPKLLMNYQAAVKKAALSKKLSIAGIVVAIVIDVLYTIVGLIALFFTVIVPIVIPLLIVLIEEYF